MSKINFSARQNLSVVSNIADGVITLQVHHKDGSSSNTFSYAYPADLEGVGLQAVVRGFKEALVTSFNGISDSAKAIAKANTAIEIMNAGKLPSRSNNGKVGAPKELPYLVQAVLRLNLVESAEAWYALTDEERTSLRTEQVNTIADALRTKAKQADADKVLEAVV